jgi:hypothetical protein
MPIRRALTLGKAHERRSHPAKIHHVTPAQAGIQFVTSAGAAARNWIPVCAGMTPCPRDVFNSKPNNGYFCP